MGNEWSKRSELDIRVWPIYPESTSFNHTCVHEYRCIAVYCFHLSPNPSKIPHTAYQAPNHHTTYRTNEASSGRFVPHYPTTISSQHHRISVQCPWKYSLWILFPLFSSTKRARVEGGRFALHGKYHLRHSIRSSPYRCHTLPLGRGV